jgi:site-specific recombinase XerD
MPRHKTRPEYVPGSLADALHQAFDVLLLDRQATGCSPHTLRYYRTSVLPFIEWLLRHGVAEPAQIAVTHIQQYSVEAHGKAKPSTRPAVNVCIRCSLNLLAERGIIGQPPKLRPPRVPTDSILRQFLSAADVLRVLRACNGLQEQALVAVLIDSGIRHCEAPPVGRLPAASRPGKGR